MQSTVKRQYNLSAQPVHLDPENVADMNYDNPLSSNINESPNFNPTENANSVENQVSSQNAEHNLQNNDIKEQALKYNSTQQPNIKYYVKYKVADSNDIVDAQIIGSAGKASGKNKNWYNTKNLAKNTLSLISWDKISS